LRAIEIENLHFVYENRREPALDRISLDINSQEFVLVAGASGCGKSTLLKCINGLIPHRYVGEYSGSVKVEGKSVAESRFLDLALTVGTVLQEADKQLVSSVVEDEVAFGPGNLALPREEIVRRVEQSLTQMDILNLAHRPVFALSGGQKQRVAIADILAMQSGILLFDEPLANLDSNAVRLMQDILKRLHEGGRTIVVAEHRTEEVLHAKPTRIVVIDHGRIVADDTDPHVLSKFKEELKVPARYLLTDNIVERVQARATERIEALQKGTLEVGVKRELIRVSDVVVEYPGGVRALDGVSLTVSEGERIALLGNNGAGKSTLALCMVGLLKPNRGKVLVGGRDTWKLTAADVAKNVCLVFQNPFSMLFAKTVREELSFGPRNLGFDQSEISTMVPETAKACFVDHLLDGSPFASSFVFGPVVGFVTGFLGNVLSDAVSFGGFFWNWDIGNGLLGAIPGIGYYVVKRADWQKARGLGAAAVLAVIASFVGIGFAAMTDYAFQIGLSTIEAAMTEFWAAFATDAVNGFILTPILLYAYASATAGRARRV